MLEHLQSLNYSCYRHTPPIRHPANHRGNPPWTEPNGVSIQSILSHNALCVHNSKVCVLAVGTVIHK